MLIGKAVLSRGDRLALSCKDFLLLINLSFGYAIPSRTAIITLFFVELAHNSALFLRKLASINAIIAVPDVFNEFSVQLKLSNILLIT
jgi:hypothetical protein